MEMIGDWASFALAVRVLISTKRMPILAGIYVIRHFAGLASISGADLYSLGVLTWVLLSGGLVNVEPPQPPTGQRRTVNDFRAHAQDCDLLLRCLDSWQKVIGEGTSLGVDGEVRTSDFESP